MSVNWNFVYVIAADFGDGKFRSKIGISRDAKKRLMALQTSSPIRLELAAAIQTPSRKLAEWIEQTAHGLLKSQRLHGEWFDCDPIRAGIAICITAHDVYEHVGFRGQRLTDFLQKSGVTPALHHLLSAGGHL